MGSITYKADGGQYEGIGLNKPVCRFSAQSITATNTPEAPLIHPKTETFDIAETPRPSAIDQQTEPPSVGEASTSYEVSKRRLSSGDSKRPMTMMMC